MKPTTLALAAVVVGASALVLCWALVTLQAGAFALLEIISQTLERTP